MPFRRVVAAFIREKGRILLARRREGDEQGGFWEFPGGGVEAGETLEEALKRELREELGVNVAVGRKIAAVQHRYGDLSIELHLFDARILNGTPSPLSHAELRWVPVEELALYPLAPADRRLLRFILP